MFLRLHRNYGEEDKNRVFSNNVNAVILNRNNKGVAFDDVYVFSPSLLFDFRCGLTFQDFPERRVSRGAGLSGLGSSSKLLGLIHDKSLAALPNVDVNPFTSVASWESVAGWFHVNAGFERNAALQLAAKLRQIPIRFSGVRGPTQDRWDFSLIKNFRIAERWNTQLHTGTFNAMYHPKLSGPNTDPASSTLGAITGQDSPRSWRMSLKVTSQGRLSTAASGPGIAIPRAFMTL